MRILHTSDIHFGIRIMGESVVESQRAICRRLAEAAGEVGAGAVVISGDVFDRAVSSRDAIAAYDELATTLCAQAGLRTFIIAGNHDGAERLAACSGLLAQAGLHVAGRLKLPMESVDMDGTGIFLLPYFSLEEARFLLGDDSIPSYDAALRALLETAEYGSRDVIAAHCFVRGAFTSHSDRSAEVGGAALAGANAFDGFGYAALGHLHGAQDAGEKARYSGTPMKYSFAEERQEKSFTVIDTSDFSRQTIPTGIGRDFVTLRGPLEELMEQVPPEDAFLRAEITDRPLDAAVTEALRRRFGQIAMMSSFLPEWEQQELTPGQAQALSYGEMLARFMEEQTGAPPEPALAEWMLAAIRQTLDEEGAAQ